MPKQQWVPPTPEQEALQPPDYTPWDAIRTLFDPQTIVKRGAVKTLSLASNKITKDVWKYMPYTEKMAKASERIVEKVGSKNPLDIVKYYVKKYNILGKGELKAQSRGVFAEVYNPETKKSVILTMHQPRYPGHSETYELKGVKHDFYPTALGFEEPWVKTNPDRIRETIHQIKLTPDWNPHTLRHELEHAKDVETHGKFDFSPKHFNQYATEEDFINR